MKEKAGNGKARRLLRSLYFPVAAVVLALAIGAVFIAVCGFDWILAYQNMLIGSLGSLNAISESLVKATPLILTGLAFAIGSRCGLVNLGAEGQVYLGGLCSSMVGIYFTGLPIYIHLPLALLAGVVGGGLWGLLTAFLKIRFGASELITGIMLNYVAIQLISYFVTGPMKAPDAAFPQSAQVAESAQLPRILNWIPALDKSRLHAGFIVAVLCVVIYYVFLWRMAKGYEMRMVGLNPSAARYAGINTGSNTLLSMFMAGGFAGLAGACEILGVQQRLFQNFSPDYGFDGIAVALLGNNNPVGVLISGFLFGALRSGSNKMEMNAAVPNSVVLVLQAVIILFVVGREMLNFFKKRDLRHAAKANAEGGQ